MNPYKAIKVTILVIGFILGASQLSEAQNPLIEIQKADFRGQRPQGAFIAAGSASRQDFVVVIVEGGDEKLIAETEGNLKGLALNGYTRLGMILCDRLPDSTAPAIIVVSGGLTYAIVHDAKADAKTSSDVYKLIRDAYVEDIISKLKSKELPTNGGGF